MIAPPVSPSAQPVDRGNKQVTFQDEHDLVVPTTFDVTANWLKQGELLYKKRFTPSWTDRFLILTPTALTVYKRKKDNAMGVVKRVFSLRRMTLKLGSDPDDDDTWERTNCSSRSKERQDKEDRTFAFRTGAVRRSQKVRAKNKEERDAWVRAIRGAKDKLPQRRKSGRTTVVDMSTELCILHLCRTSATVDSVVSDAVRWRRPVASGPMAEGDELEALLSNNRTLYITCRQLRAMSEAVLAAVAEDGCTWIQVRWEAVSPTEGYPCEGPQNLSAPDNLLDALSLLALVAVSASACSLLGWPLAPIKISLIVVYGCLFLLVLLHAAKILCSVRAKLEGQKRKERDPRWEFNIEFVGPARVLPPTEPTEQKAIFTRVLSKDKTGRHQEPWGKWEASEAEGMLVRGNSYLQDRVKIPAGDFKFDLMHTAVWLMEDATTTDELRAICTHPDSYFQNHLRATANSSPAEGEPAPLWLAINFMIFDHGASLINTMYLRQRQDIDDAETDDNFTRLLHRFLDQDDQFRDKRLKFIPRIIEGHWIARRTVGRTPTIIGNKLHSTYYHHMPTRKGGDRLLEVDIDVCSSNIAQHILRVVKGYAVSLVIDLNFLLEAQTEDELPERLLGGVRLSNVICSAAVPMSVKGKPARPVVANTPNVTPTSRANALHTRTRSGGLPVSPTPTRKSSGPPTDSEGERLAELSAERLAELTADAAIQDSLLPSTTGGESRRASLLKKQSKPARKRGSSSAEDHHSERECATGEKRKDKRVKARSPSAPDLRKRHGKSRST